MTAFKPADEGGALIARLFNATSQTQRADIDWGKLEPERVERSTLAEAPGEELRGPFDMAPWEIVTLRLVVPIGPLAKK